MLRALIVDDSEGFAQGARDYFAQKGWSVKLADSAGKAIEALDAEVFDVVVLDRKMPVMWGDEVLRWMSNRSEHQYTCTVMCTAHGDVKGATEALKLGAWQYIQKPVRDLSLLEALLIPGIALKQCNRMRSELLMAESLSKFFEKLREICVDTVGPAGLHLLFVSADGQTVDLLGAAGSQREHHAFVENVVATGKTVFEEDGVKTDALDPILPDSKTILAVPVRGERGEVIGVLDMEGAEERAFGRAWQEVLRYIADLIAIFRVNEIKAQQAAAAMQAASAMLYRELRHRISTHAQVVSMQTRELLDEKPNASSLRRLEIIQRNADTIDFIVRELREASTEHTLNKASVDLTRLLEKAIEETRVKKKPENRQPPITFYGLDAIPAVKVNADESWLMYSFECVLDNAWEAITERWKQDTNWKDSETGEIRLAAELDGNSINLSIGDNGIGFEGRDKELLFTALYSTKTRLAQGEETPDTGVGRITQMLSIMGSTISLNADLTERLENRRGFDIAISDRDLVTMQIQHKDLGNTPVELKARLVSYRKNRGIGLYTTRRIITQHGGSIQAQSPGVFQGAMFLISLPVSA